MSPDALKRAALALGGLIVLLAGFTLLRRGQRDEIPTLALPHLTAADVDRITITTPSDTLRLVQAGTTWTVNGYPADGVDDVFGALAADSARGAELVASSPTSHERMGVTDSAGRRLVLAKGDRTLADLVVGERSRGAFGVYLRPSDGDAVYRADAGFARVVERDLTQWRDRHVAAIPSDSIGRVDIQRTDGRYTIARADSGRWTVDGTAADSTAVMRVVGSFRELEVAGFPAPEIERDSMDFSRPYRRLAVLSLAGDTLLALMFDSTAAGAWARRPSGGPVYRFDRWRLDALMPADSTLRGS